MTVRPDMEALARELEPAPHAIPIRHDVFVWSKEAAEAKGWTVAELIDWALRQWFGRERER